VLIGKRPPKAILELAQKEPAVQVMGYVPDPTPLLAQTAAFIVPLRSGAGMRVKILDAWRWGVPIVSTQLGAEGISARDGEHLLLADEPRVFAQAVLRLLMEPETRARLRSNGQQWVSQHYNWRSIYPKWAHVYEELLR
ncbi:MAG: glycosyltransferase, partial [Anaerolineae bacterium]|nr:glycosyltransferase [Anaerolineae bacterium]